MNKTISSVLTTDSYISQFPLIIQEKLNALRNCIKQASPNSYEKISYQMPTFDLHGNLVHFAAFSNHIGFYPGSSGVEAFKSKLNGYRFSKGAIQFPIDHDLPLDLVKEIVIYRVKENLALYQQKLALKKRK